jgi:hypothetical protein
MPEVQRDAEPRQDPRREIAVPHVGQLMRDRRPPLRRRPAAPVRRQQQDRPPPPNGRRGRQLGRLAHRHCPPHPERGSQLSDQLQRVRIGHGPAAALGPPDRPQSQQ